ncbi:cellulose binding domain-containing protein [Streptomyces sp. AM 2-1-1]|uniref:GH12 family glycosyl hydrolase domain-containing protein n=1 Tax=unclassified Streptomyces TaxID=2593676 RepID=UPI0023B9B0EB|nr:cellulose binding domain-containing protein [Streptomyces sp. AM 2-1-1]WEH41236.1 cellulose binding domain-containing protein [Streptomyces sp. AM 2-1-1]
MRHRARTLLTALTLMLGTTTALLTATPATQAATQATQATGPICEQYGSTTVQGRYTVQNNRWGTSATQCLNVTDSGFTVTQADGSVATNGAPKSYPSIFLGCHYTNCSPGTNLPKRVDTIAAVPTSLTYGYVSNATYDAAFDIWLDPQPKTDGVNRTEIMIWFNRVGSIQPIGSPTSSATIGGKTWQIWTGNNGGNDVISFVAPSAITSWSFDVKDFIDRTVSQGMAASNWYLTSVQAGFEPWVGGAGLSLSNFSSSVTDGQDTNGNGTGGTTEPGGGTGNPPPTGQTACQVEYTPNVWPGGFTTNVTVKNTGTTAVNGWNLGFTLPSGQQVSQAWNATVSPSSGALTARNTTSNAAISPGGTQSFGFQGTWTGTFAEPSAFTLGGAACTVV